MNSPTPERKNLREQEGTEAKQSIIDFISNREYAKASELIQDWVQHARRWSPEELVNFYWPQQAFVYLKSQNFHKARQTLNLLLEENPTNPTALSMLAYIELLDRDTTKAIYRYTELMKNPAYFKQAKAVLNVIGKSDDLDKLLSDKKESFFYRHPDEFLKLTIRQFRPWIKDKWLKNRHLLLNLKRIIIFLILITLIYGGGHLVYLKWFKPPPKTIIEIEIENGSTWGQFYQRMENAISVQDFNTAIISYNQAKLKGIPKQLEEYFKYLSQFIVTPTPESIPLTKSFTHLRNEPQLYHNLFVRIQGRISPIGRNQYSIVPVNRINETLIIKFIKPDFKPNYNEQYEVLTVFNRSQDARIYFTGISARTLITENRE